MTNGNKPVRKFRAGGVSAAVWKNTAALKNGSEMETLAVTLDRRYKDNDGIWKSSGSLSGKRPAQGNTGLEQGV